MAKVKKKATKRRARKPGPPPSAKVKQQIADLIENGRSAAVFAPISMLKMWEDNPRKAQPVEGVAQSIDAWDFAEVIVARLEDGEIIAGHTRLKAARKLGLEEVPVRFLDISRREAHRLARALNAWGEHAKWDPRKLLAQIETDQKQNPALVQAQGFRAAQVSALLRRAKEDTKKARTEGALPMPLEKAITKPGDMWRLGDHRLLCGDATNPEDVKRALDNERAAVCVTDPPYGVAVRAKGKKSNAIRGDLTQTVIPFSYELIISEALEDHGRIYMFGGQANFVMYAKLFDRYLHTEPRVIVWVKDSHVLRPNNYHSRYELCYYGWKGKGGGKAHWFGDRKYSDVWEVARDRDARHPTQKPVDLMAIPIRNSAPVNGLVYEPFAGSGSTLIACEREGRRCAALELDPVWCDFIVARWKKFTGKEAKREPAR